MHDANISVELVSGIEFGHDKLAFEILVEQIYISVDIRLALSVLSNNLAIFAVEMLTCAH